MSDNTLQSLPFNSTESELEPPAETASIVSNLKLRDQARQMYYSGIFVTEIVEALNLDINELHRFVFGKDGLGTAHNCWAHLKLHRPRSSAVTYEKVKPFILKSTEFKLLNRIRASVDDMETNDTLLDMDDMSKAMGMVERIDKITRLEEGKATAITETTKRTFTLRDIQDARKESEKEEIVEAEFTEVLGGESGAGKGFRPPVNDTEENEAPGTPSSDDGGSGSSGD